MNARRKYKARISASQKTSDVSSVNLALSAKEFAAGLEAAQKATQELSKALSEADIAELINRINRAVQQDGAVLYASKVVT